MRYTNQEQQAFYQLSKAYLSGVQSQAPTEQITELSSLINYHEWRYYVLNDPVISDFEYDQLYKMLEALEAAHPALIRPSSPTQRVSSDLTEDFPTVRHIVPMLSLANSYNEADMQDFEASIRKLTDLSEEEPIQYAIEPKYDGGSITLIYENDQLVRAATRGNGAEGDEITNNARTIRSVPLQAAFSKHGIYRAELRGEAVINKQFFAQANKERAEAGLTLFANPRNTASGGLRMKNPGEAAKRGLEVFIYQLAYAVDQSGNNMLPALASHSHSLDILDSLGFKLPKSERKVTQGLAEVLAFYHDWAKKRDSYDYEIDGMVIKVDRFDLQEKCGATSHHPRWAIAYKFKAKQATTRLLKVEFQVGKVGSITPVAKVEPVHLAGVTVSSISLHNEDFIQSKDLRIGDFVVIERAGDVIPYIVKSLPDLRTGEEEIIEFPVNCPMNDTEQIPLERLENEAAWRCPTCTCGAQPLQRMIFHVSKDAMNIDGFGKAYIERFQSLGWLDDIADIYALDYEKIAALEGFGEKSAQNLKKAIDKAKKNPIKRLLHSLSIHHLGKKASKLIAGEIDHVLDLASWQEEDYTNIKEIGPILAKNMMAFFQNKENIQLLNKLESHGVNLAATADDRPLKQAEEGPLVGKTILFTGSLQQMTRKEAQAKAEAAGAKNISAVSSNLNILVVGEKAGSKLRKAESLGTVSIMTEEDFLALLDATSKAN